MACATVAVVRLRTHPARRGGRVADLPPRPHRFRLGGARKATFDAFNSLCSATHGALKAYVHDHPERSLPATQTLAQQKVAAKATKKAADEALKKARADVKAANEVLKKKAKK